MKKLKSKLTIRLITLKFDRFGMEQTTLTYVYLSTKITIIKFILGVMP